MEKTGIDESIQSEERFTEFRVLILYTIYTAAMLIATVSLGWDRWIIPILIAAGIAAWGTYLGQYRTYEFRSFLMSGITMVNFVIYGINAQDFMAMIPAMGAVAIMLAIYGVEENIYVVMGCSVLVLLYHIFYVGDVRWRDSAIENCRQMVELISAFVTEYLAWYLVKKQIEDKKNLQETNNRMDMAEQSKNDFLANMSHELRTPINTVTGMSELVLQKDLPIEAREDVFDIQIAGRGLLSIVTDILDYTELESGNVELEEEPYNIISTVNDVINMALAQNQEKKLELIIDCNASIPCGLLGDEQKIRRIMTNLVGNAIKFTDKGCVTITISYRKEEYGINLNVRVKDTGIGLGQQEIEQMFYGFYQADAKRSRREEGVGLGLAISNALVHRLGGFLTVQSSPGKGSEFSFSLPQVVLDESPAIVVEHPQTVSIICYFDIEKYSFTDIRDDYMRSMNNMAKTLGVPMQICRTQTELGRRIKENYYSHLFVGRTEYIADRDFYVNLTKQMVVTVIVDRADEAPAEPGVGCIFKPFYALSIANVINGNTENIFGKVSDNSKPFVAPEAKILIVDDNVMNLKVAEGLLLQYKIRIATAISGEEALEKIKTMDYDFVFMDHMMPGMDGVETLHRIRQKPGRYYQTVPIIALTANAIGGAREMFIQEGFQDFVAKPIDLVVLERVLRRFIPERKMIPSDEYEDYLKGQNKQDSSAVEPVINPKEQDLADKENPENEVLEKEGINLEKALEYFAGDRAAYAEIAGIYCATGDEKIPEIQSAYESEDWKNYVVLVHAVKSTSLTVGAVQLSEMAKALEFAGKEGRIEDIRADHAAMMTEYKRVIEVLKKSGIISSHTEEGM